MSNSLNQKCSSVAECDQTKNLTCKDGMCQCNHANLFWNEKLAQCVTKLGLNEKCSDNELCNDQVGLLCQNGICNCANNSYWKDNKCGKNYKIF